MSGRFLTPPFLVAVIALLQAKVWETRKFMTLGVGLAAVTVSLLFSSPGLLSPSTLNDGSRNELGINDERGFYYRGLGLRSPTRGTLKPSKITSLLMAAGRTDVPIGVRDFIGMEGFTAGPQVHLVDRLLCDPLLARLPVIDASRWRIGHFSRRVPKGYLETLRTGINQIDHPDLALFYDEVRLITRGDLFDLKRLAAIGRQLRGANDHLVDSYLRESYYSPKMTIGNAQLIPKSRPAEIDWAAAGALVLYKNGTELSFDSTQHGSQLILGMHYGDLIRVHFFRGQNSLGYVEFKSQDSFLNEFDEVSMPLPSAVSEGFDRIQLHARISRDGVVAVVWMRIE